MDNPNNNRSRRRKSKARERIEKRRQRRETVTNLTSEGLEILPDINLKGTPDAIRTPLNIIRDTIWRFQQDMPVGLIVKAVGGFVVIFAGFFLLTTLFSSNIGPNVSTMDIRLSGMSVDEATEALFLYWNEEAMINIQVDGETFESVRPSDIGISLDATATAEAAKAVGMAGFPFGREIEPVISSDYGDIQSYMLSIANAVYIPSYEAGYEWRDGELVSVMGISSRELDIVQSIQRIVDDPLLVVQNGSVELVTNSTPPTIIDADPYYEDARQFVLSEFTVQGYDPFVNQTEYWGTTRQEMAEWLVVTDNGLAIRDGSLDDFVDTINTRIDIENWSRYVDPLETEESVTTAFLSGSDTANVRIRYSDSTYELQQGDWGFRLARRIGLPFFNIQVANPSVEFDTIYPGETIAIPSRDLVIPLEPIQDRRIVVDLERRYLVAFEGTTVVHHWPISTGTAQFPTQAGVFQILNKNDVAYGSSFANCNDNNECGQWEMDYFMGIYDVGVGLTNGFHGDVRLPNGQLLSGGSTQLASTFGCVMSDDLQAQILFEWAETGIIVEMVDQFYPPQSDLGFAAMEFITSVGQS